MRSVILFEDEKCNNFLPLTLWRSVFELQVGGKILLDRIAQRLQVSISGVWTRDWLATVAAQRCGTLANSPATATTVLVNGRWIFNESIDLPNRPCVGMIDGDIAFAVLDQELASRFTPETMLDIAKRGEAIKGIEQVSVPGYLIEYPWQIVRDLCELLIGDWDENAATLEPKIDTTNLVNPDRIRIGSRSCIHRTAILDASTGPIHISHDVVIGAYAVIQGPVYIGPGTKIHPHTLLHGGNAIGPVCRIGGELDGCVIHGYTNKQHNGFLGHAYVGSWVNLGAGSNNSDLKNTYGSVRVHHGGRSIDTKQTSFGAVIGDHAKIGINATIPTGAIVGFAATIATSQLIPKNLPAFAWLTEDGLSQGDPARLLDVATRVMARRNVDMTDDEIELFLALESKA